jgi:ribosome-associated protein
MPRRSTPLLVSEGRSVKDAAALHRAERWRESLIADDAELQRWLAEYPATDAQQLRALIRQARKDAREGQPGEAQRQGRAYRQLFALVRAQLTPSGEP